MTVFEPIKASIFFQSRSNLYIKESNDDQVTNYFEDNLSTRGTKWHTVIKIVMWTLIMLAKDTVILSIIYKYVRY